MATEKSYCFHDQRKEVIKRSRKELKKDQSRKQPQSSLYLIFVDHFGSISKSSIRYLASDISAVSYKYLHKYLTLNISTSSPKYLNIQPNVSQHVAQSISTVNIHEAPNTQYTRQIYILDKGRTHLRLSCCWTHFMISLDKSLNKPPMFEP